MPNCFLDCEFSSLHEDGNLLTASFVIEKGAPNGLTVPKIKEYSFKLKTSMRDDRNEPVYIMTPQSMAVNKIDLAQHDLEADSEETVTNNLNQFLKHQTSKYLGVVKGVHKTDLVKLTPCGHGCFEDLQRLKAALPGVSFDKYFTHDIRDTKHLACFLRDCGKLPNSMKMSLQSLAEYFSIEHLEAHTATGDALTTMKLYEALKTLVTTQDGFLEQIKFAKEYQESKKNG